MFDFIDDRYNLMWDDDKFLLTAKKLRSRDLVNYMLDRSQQIFVWKGLPDTIPERNLELLLQTCGNICITEVTDVPEGHGDPGLYAMWGGLGGELNAYYEPTLFVVANPYLNFTEQLKIGVECVHLRNDALGIGLLPMFSKYASMMNENEISLNLAAINYRVDQLISADDDRTAESARQFFKDIIAGKYGVISSSEFFEGLQVDAAKSNGKNITELIEYEQYLKASWYNEIGLNSNYNMKRERIVASEAQLQDDALIPLVENMLYQRQQGVEHLKELYGDKYDLEDLTVELNYIWDLDQLYVSIPESAETDMPQEGEDAINGGNNTTIDDGAGFNPDTPETITEDDTPDEDGAPDGDDISTVINEINEAIENIEDSIDNIEDVLEGEPDETE